MLLYVCVLNGQSSRLYIYPNNTYIYICTLRLHVLLVLILCLFYLSSLCYFYVLNWQVLDGVDRHRPRALAGPAELAYVNHISLLLSFCNY